MSSAASLAQHHQLHGVQPVLPVPATVLQAPVDQPWGLREMVLQAPGGHRLVLGAEAPSPNP